MIKKTQDSRPLITYALFAYNQEKFIREAVEGAFSQTYSPLEIVLSDDRSTDDTFQIITEMVNKYDGPHQIIVNCNERNLGLGGHVNKVFGLSSGELIIVAAGDDISLPERCSTMVSNWINEGKPHVLQSAFLIIDSYGEKLIEESSGSSDVTNKVLCVDAVEGEKKDIYFPASSKSLSDHVFNKKRVKVVGASMAYSRKIFEDYPPLSNPTLAEDQVLAFRGLLEGGILFINSCLVKYRKHDSNLFFFNQSNKYTEVESNKKILSIRKNVLESNLADITYWKPQTIQKKIARHLCIIKLKLQIVLLCDRLKLLSISPISCIYNILRSLLILDITLSLKFVKLLMKAILAKK